MYSKVYGLLMTANAASTGTRPLMRVADLAKRVGVNPDTIRYYEKAGLLPAPARTASDQRRYGQDAVDRLQFIQGMQRLGLKLREIRDLLAVRDTGQCPCEPAADLLARRIDEIDTEMRRLSDLRSQLTSMRASLPTPDCEDPLPGRWMPDDAHDDRDERR